MIRNISIKLFIKLIFSLFAITIIILFFVLLTLDKEKHYSLNIQRYSLIANVFLNDLQQTPSIYHLNNLYVQYNIQLVPNGKRKEKILKKAKVMRSKKTDLGSFQILSFHGSNFIYVKRIGYDLLLVDTKPKTYSLFLSLVSFGILLFILFILYALLRRKLYPLHSFKIAIDKFSQGHFNVHIGDYGDDEIGKIVKSFNIANNYISELISSKNLFMRNMMHELKTPITKALILSEYMENKEHKTTLIKALNNMNQLISQLANIEKLSTQKYKLNMQVVKLHEVITIASDNLFLDENNVIYFDKNLTLYVDKLFFLTAVQNLMDNAIKFSSDKKVMISNTDNSITFSSHSKKLQNNLSYYTDAFSQEEKKMQGFGLGLYIVDTVLKLHKFTLTYSYNSNQSQFTIII